MENNDVIYGYVRIPSTNSKEDFVRLTDVICVIAKRDYCEVHTKCKKYMLPQPLCEVEEKLTFNCFVRVGRSCVINITWLVTILGNMLILKNDMRIVVSKTAMTAFREKIVALGCRKRAKQNNFIKTLSEKY